MRHVRFARLIAFSAQYNIPDKLSLSETVLLDTKSHQVGLPVSLISCIPRSCPLIELLCSQCFKVWRIPKDIALNVLLLGLPSLAQWHRNGDKIQVVRKPVREKSVWEELLEQSDKRWLFADRRNV